MRLVAALAVLLLAVPAGCGSGDADPDRGTGAPATPLRVDGNRFVGADGREVPLRGFNFSGAEYACVEGDGFFDTPDGGPPSERVVAAMRRWRGARAVRVPLNEQCWLGLASVPAAHAGRAYRSAVRTFVERLNAAGLVAVLDLHRSAPGDGVPRGQEPMPDREHSPGFWRSAAAEFRTAAVVFDLFNEPFPYGDTDSDRAWRCWRDGGCTLTSVNTGRPYVAAGMNELIAAVRSTGSRQPVLAGGIHWAESLTGWLAHRPDDPLGQLGASFHAYSFNEYCSALRCYDRDLAPIARQVPLFAGEIGPTLTVGSAGVDAACPRSAVRGGGFADSTLDWLGAHAAGYAAWSWNPWPDCWALVRDWGGEPTALWGVGLRRRLAAAQGGG
ncbi:cellulase family glycosylhydrolase [Actinoplanes sp. NPDC049316]|uniref:glycoside hydrolase family 5 protein n=1 Tax=Actinoplanes sp. NPDC049316 TaxID=3154727 RepID=UPI00342B42CB